MEPAASQGDGEQSWAGFARFVVVLVAVGAGLTTLAQAVLPGEPAGVVSTVLSVAGSGLILARVNRLRGRRRTSSAGARTVPRTVPQLPRLPRLGLRVAVNALVGVPFAVAWVLAVPVVLFGWPVEFPADEHPSRWLLAVGGPIAAALMVHELVREVRELPGARRVLDDIVGGRARRHPGTVTRRGYDGMSVRLQRPDGEAAQEVRLAVAAWRRRTWDPLPGDEVLLRGELRERRTVLVTTADGSRWRRVLKASD